MIYSDEQLWEGKKQIAILGKELHCSENNVVYALLCIGNDLVKEKLAKDAKQIYLMHNEAKGQENEL